MDKVYVDRHRRELPMLNRHILNSLISSIVPQSFILLVFIYLSIALDAAQFGKYVLYEGYFIILSSLLAFGSDKVLERYAAKDISFFYHSTIRSLKITVFISILLFLSGSQFIGLSFLEIMLLNIASLSYCILIIYSSFLLGNLYTKELLVLRMIRVAVYGIFIILIDVDRVSVIYLKSIPEIISALVSLSVLIIFMRRKCKDIEFKINKKIEMHSKYSQPFLISVLSGLVITQLDKIILTNYLSLSEIATLGYMQKYITIYVIVGVAFSAVFAPVFYKKIGSDSLFLNLNLAVLFYGAMLSVVVGNTAFKYIYPEDYLVGIDLFIFMMIGSFLNIATSYTSVLVLLKNEKSFLNMFSGVFSAVIFVIILITLAPEYRLLAPAIAFNIASFVLYLTQSLLIRKYSIDFNTFNYLMILMAFSLFLIYQRGVFFDPFMEFNTLYISLFVGFISTFMILYYLYKLRTI